MRSPFKIVAKDAGAFLDSIPEGPVFDLTITSPPYNIGKSYERRMSLAEYLSWQGEIITRVARRTKPWGSICWQVGNHISGGGLEPLDAHLHPLFRRMGLVLRNRIIWTFGHGLHCKNRFSGRYEVILWYTKGAGYFFDLNAVRVPQKYPSKKYFKGPRAGELSCNPLGKNPGDYWDDVWDNIPNVKSNHVEKTIHPCQFPVGLAERLVLALCPPRGKVLDPFCGSGSTAVAALFHGREFVGCDTSEEYVRLARERAGRAARGEERFRPHDLAIVQPQAMRGMAR